LAKNDKIDASLIATCTAAAREIHAVPDQRLAELATQQTLIDQIVDQIARAKNCRESCRDPRQRQFPDKSSTTWPRPSASTATSPRGSI
jgi:transposase